MPNANQSPVDVRFDGVTVSPRKRAATELVVASHHDLSTVN